MTHSLNLQDSVKLSNPQLHGPWMLNGKDDCNIISILFTSISPCLYELDEIIEAHVLYLDALSLLIALVFQVRYLFIPPALRHQWAEKYLFTGEIEQLYCPILFINTVFWSDSANDSRVDIHAYLLTHTTGFLVFPIYQFFSQSIVWLRATVGGTFPGCHAIGLSPKHMVAKQTYLILCVYRHTHAHFHAY